MHSSQVTLPLPDGIDLALFCGPQDANLRAIEDLFDATIALRSDSIVMTGDALEVPLISALVSDLFDMVQADKAPTVEDIRRAVEVLRNSDYSPSSLREDILLTYRGRAIRPKTSGQKRYCDAIRDSTVTFAIGPAGTGKTYLAMAMAIAALKRKEIGRIILTRPVVEAGENLGFLPGTLDEKVDPYVRPLYDALFDLTDMEKGNQLISQGVIEIAPLPSCADAPSMTPFSFSTRRRTPRPSSSRCSSPVWVSVPRWLSRGISRKSTCQAALRACTACAISSVISMRFPSST